MKNLHNETTILLIENDSDWLVDVYSTLQEAGYDVLIATGGNEGFCLARRVRPDLIISEAALPDISGVQLCRMIRADEHLRDTLFLLIGETRGAEGGGSSLDGFDAGADDCFEGDCNPQFLAAKVTRLIALRRSEKEIQFGFQRLHRSESHLAILIEDASKLIASLDLPVKQSASYKSFAPKSKTFFDLAVEPKKQKAVKTLQPLKKNADQIAVWKQSLQIKDFSRANEFGKERSAKAYYEIAS